MTMSSLSASPLSLRLVVKNTFFEWVDEDVLPARLTRSVSVGDLSPSASDRDIEANKSMHLTEVQRGFDDAVREDGKVAADREFFSTEDTDMADDSPRSSGSFPQSPVSSGLAPKRTFFESLDEDAQSGSLIRQGSEGKLSCLSSDRDIEVAADGVVHPVEDTCGINKVNSIMSTSPGRGDDQSSRACAAYSSSSQAPRWSDDADVAATKSLLSNQSTFVRHVRPCKGKRMRWVKLTAYLVKKIEEDPVNFDFDGIGIPGSLAQDTLRVEELFDHLRAVADKVMAGSRAA